MTTVLAAAAFAAFLARLAVMVRLHTMDSGYDPVEHAVSDYAVGPTRPWATAASWLNAAGAALLAAALATGPAWDRRTEIVVLLVVYAVLAAGIIAAPTDLEGADHTRSGRIHMLVAIVTFTLGYEITSDGTPGLTHLPGWQGLATLLWVLRWLNLAGLVGVVVTLLVKPLRGVFGIVERVFLGSLLVWFIVVAGQLTFVR